MNGSVEIVELLIKNKVNLKAKDQYGLTAYVYALKEHQKEIAIMLKENGGTY